MPVKKNSDQAIQISANLQKLLLVAAGTLFVMQLVSTLFFLSTAEGNMPVSFWLYQASIVLLPAAYFLLALWYVGRGGTLLKRSFKAVLIAVCGILVLTAAAQLAYMYPVVFKPDMASHGWTHYPYYLMGAVTAAYTIVLVGLRTKRISRG